MHTWLIEWVPVRPVRSDVTVIIVSAGDEGFGRVPCLDSRKRLGTVGEKCSHTPPSICQQLWPLLSGFVWKWYVWWRKGTSPTPLLSHSETPPHFVIAHWLYVPQQLCRCLRSSFLPSISFCLSLSSSSCLLTPPLSPPTPPPPPLLLNSDRLFISFCLAASPPTPLTRFSLLFLLFWVHVKASAHMCVCKCAAAKWRICVWVFLQSTWGCVSLVCVCVCAFVVHMVWVCSRRTVRMLSCVSALGFRSFFLWVH